jgi:predicted esterase
VAIAAMPPYRRLPGGLPSGARRSLVVNGAADALVTEEMTESLVAQLRTVGATVELLRHEGGHEVPAELLPAIAAFVAAAG